MVNVVFTQSREIFDKFNVPKFHYCQSYICKNFLFPFGLEFERTYYKRNNDGLTAFRILAYTINDSDCLNKKLTFLVQLPNKSPQWISDFINVKTNIYDSAEEYILTGGTKKVNLLWGDLIQGGIGHVWHGYNDRYFFKNDIFYTIKNGAISNSTGHYCSNLFVSKNGWLVQIAKRSLESYHGEEGIYLTNADAMKVLIKDMPISDFAEEPINIDITILPNTPKYTKVMIIE